MSTSVVDDYNFQVCTPRFLPPDKIAVADAVAVEVNPENRAENAHRDHHRAPGGKDRLVVNRRVYWGKKGVRLTVGFLDGPSAELRAKILFHMNAWSHSANVGFVESASDPQVRITRSAQPSAPRGHWSYMGTDILLIGADEPTMNLEGFTMATPDSEFFRVVRHETGHTLGFPHEHMRQELVDCLDEEKVIAEFMRVQGWTRQQVIDQVLTPLERSSILGSRAADANSIMCYQIPGHLTKDGRIIRGGADISALDFAIARALYPKEARGT